MKNLILIIIACFTLIQSTKSQDIELTEGALKLTTYLGVGYEETATISNAGGVISLDPASGHPVRVNGPHNLEIQKGDIHINDGGLLRLESPNSQYMFMNIDTINGGLQILRNNTSNVGLYIDDDTDYLSIGQNNFLGYASEFTHFEINQEPSKKAITINETIGSNYWEMGIDGLNNNLRLYFNGSFKGEFSSLDGSYNPVVVIPVVDSNNKSKNLAKSAIKITDVELIAENQNVDQDGEVIILLEKISALESRILSLESRIE